jgi:CheY-like chemotaxis protein
MTADAPLGSLWLQGLPADKVTGRMRTLLLADDSVTVQRVIALTFAEEDIQVVSVSDGQQAMEKIAAQTPDIVLAGTSLPQVNGYELARFIRNKPELKSVPVLLLSGAFETVDEARLLSSGANGYIEKPVEPTVVIGRVKELLGLKAETRTPVARRLVGPAEAPPAKQLPIATPPRAVTSTRGTPSKWDQLRAQTGLDGDTRSVEDSTTRSDDYLGTLDDVFDSIDQQLSGRAPKKGQRHPPDPIGHPSDVADSRSAGRRPAPPPQPGHQVFEVDDEWFGAGQSPAAAETRERRREIADDLRDPEIQPQRPSRPADPIYEVAEEWFAEADQAKAEKLVEQKQLAAEMGIQDLELPDPPAKDLGLDDLRQIVADTPAAAPVSAAAPAPVSPVSAAPPVHHPAVIVALPRVAKVPPVSSAEPIEPPTLASTPITDDFAALLAVEQGESPMPAPVPIKATPGPTADLIERVVRDVVAATSERLIKEAVSQTVDRVARDIMLEASERIVREEIARIRSRNKS